MSQQPTIDVIIAVYNGEKFIQEAINTVREQTWSSLNIIVADDGSDDQTVSILERMAQQDHRITLIKRPHAGVSATLNAAIKQSTADYVAFLDADDLWHHQKLEKQMHCLINSDYDLCFSMMQEFESFDKGVETRQKARNGPLKGYSKSAFLGRRSLFEQFGHFNEDVAIGDFVEWFSRVIRDGAGSSMLDEILTYRRIHHHNTTRSVQKNAFLSLLKKHLEEKRQTEI